MMRSHQGIGMTSRRTRGRMIARLRQQGIRNSKVLDIMHEVPRHIFMDEALASRAYEDTALPIGYNQTISQPYIVARMTELLIAEKKPARVLEIGTGCGYQSAILAHLSGHVYTVERISPLMNKAKKHMREINVRNITFLHNDGGWGWPEKGPYDGILVTAAPQEIPEMLLEQMAVGGVMIIPIGGEGAQKLQKVVRTENEYQVEVLDPVSFVPFLTGRN